MPKRPLTLPPGFELDTESPAQTGLDLRVPAGFELDDDPGLPALPGPPRIEVKEVARPSQLADIGKSFVGGAASATFQGFDAIGDMSGANDHTSALIDEQNRQSRRRPIAGSHLAQPTRGPINLKELIENQPTVAGNVQGPPMSSEQSIAIARQQRQGLHDQAMADILPEPPASEAGQAASMLGSTVPFIAATALAGPAGPLASGTLGVMMGAREARERSDRSGIPLTDGQRIGTSVAGAAVGSLDAIPVGHLFGKLKKAKAILPDVEWKKVGEQLYPGWKQYLKDAGIQAAEEGGQELVSGVAQDAIEASYGGRRPDQVGAQWKDDLVGGGATGAFLDVLFKMAGSRGGRARLRKDGVDPERFREWAKTELPQPAADETQAPGSNLQEPPLPPDFEYEDADERPRYDRRQPELPGKKQLDDSVYQSARDLAKREGKLDARALRNALAVNNADARTLVAKLIADGTITAHGKYLPSEADTPLLVEEEAELPDGETFNFEPAQLGRQGRSATVSGTEIDFQYAAVPLGAPVASHDLAGNENPSYPRQAQPRQRDRAASLAQYADVGSKLEYGRLNDDPLVNFGAPVVGPDLVSEAGTGRLNSLRWAAANRPEQYAKYKADARADAARLGIRPETLDNLGDFAIVRVRRSPVNRAQFAREANVDPQQRMSPSEVAKVDAGRIGDLLDRFDAESEITSPKNREFVLGFMKNVAGSTERSGLMTAEGTLSQEGARRIKNAVFTRAYGDSTAIETLSESTDSTIKPITNGMLRAAPALAKVKQGIKAKTLHDRDITPDIAEAARKLAWLKQTGTTVADYLAQQGLIGKDISPEARELLKAFNEHARSPRRIGDTLIQYAKAVKELGNPEQKGLFGTGTTPSKGELLSGAIEFVLEKENAVQAPVRDGERVPGNASAPPAPKSGRKGSQGVESGAAAGSVKAPAEAKEVKSLPTHLSGANPRYKQFEVNFASDLDRAAYITAQTKPSKRDSEYINFVIEQTGLTEPEVRAAGVKIRASLKALESGADPKGKLTAPALLSGAPSPSKLPAQPAQPAQPEWKPLTDEEVAAEIKRQLKVEADAAGARIKERLKKLGSDTRGQATPEKISTEDLKAIWRDLVTVGAFKISSGFTRVERFTTSMVAEFGEWIREHAPRLHEASLDYFEGKSDALREDLTPPEPGQFPIDTPEAIADPQLPAGFELEATTQGALALDPKPQPEKVANDTAVPEPQAQAFEKGESVEFKQKNGSGEGEYTATGEVVSVTRKEVLVRVDAGGAVRKFKPEQLTVRDYMKPYDPPKEGAPLPEFGGSPWAELREQEAPLKEFLASDPPELSEKQPGRYELSLPDGSTIEFGTYKQRRAGKVIIYATGWKEPEGNRGIGYSGSTMPAGKVRAQLAKFFKLRAAGTESQSNLDMREVLETLDKKDAEKRAESDPPKAPGPVASPEKAAEEKKPERDTEYELSSTQVNLPAAIAKRFVQAAARIPKGELHEKGRIEEAHVTLLFGLHSEDPEAVRELLAGEGPITIKFGKTSLFKNDEFDVLKVGVESADLRRLNKKIADALPHTNEFGDYKPHATVAYLKPGEGGKYEKQPLPGISGQEVTINEVAFSDKNGKHTVIKLAAAVDEVGGFRVDDRVQSPGRGGGAWRGTVWGFEKSVAGVRLLKIKVDDRPQLRVVDPSEVVKIAAEPKKPEFGQGNSIRWTAPDGRKLHGYITSVSSTEYRVRAHPQGEAGSTVANQTIEYVPFDAKDLVKDTGGPEKPTQQKLVDRIFYEITRKEDIRLKLERIAEEVYQGKRAEGAFEMRDLYEAQEAAVNRWLMTRGEELLGMESPSAAVAEIRDMLGRLATQTVRNQEQIDRQQFSTPPQIAWLIAKLADPQKSDVVLEPSAGVGGLVAMLKNVVAELHLNEIAPERAALAEVIGLPKATNHDAETIHALLDRDIKPTLIVMNPPFTAGAGGALKGIKFGFNHLQSALQRLEPGGRVVMIHTGGRSGQFQASEGASMTSPTARVFWQKIVQTHHVRANVRLAGKEYAKYGTTMPVQIIVIDKTGPTPGSNYQEQVAQAITGDFATVEEAYAALRTLAGSRSTAADGAGATDGSGSRAEGDRHDVQPSTGNLFESVPGPGAEVSRGLEPGERRREAPLPERPGQTGGKDRAPVAARAPEPTPEAAPPAEPAPQPSGPSGSGDKASRGNKTVKVEQVERTAEEQADVGAFVRYQPSIAGNSHPGVLVETRTMATVPSPKFTYKPALPEDVKVSAVQLEAVILAGQQNEIRLGDGARGAALIGDGTGVGKGRIAAAIVLDNWNQGRRQILYVSESWKLMEDFIGYLKDVGAPDLALKVRALRKYDSRKPIDHQGIVFTTYASLRAKDKSHNKRSDQVRQWLMGKDEAESGYVIFDESHNLKNAVPLGKKGKAEPSQIGVTVKDLLKTTPNLRTVSMSATAASEVGNLGYLDRLGLWGPGTPFPGGFGQFANEIARNGVSAMEMVARELKASGKYLARTLAFKADNGEAVTYRDAEHALNPDQRAIYSTAAEAWQMVNGLVDKTVETINGGHQAKTGFMTQYYSAQQRFFALLLTALKAPSAIAEAQQAVSEGKSVVITLVNTSEAAQNREKAKVALSEDEDDETDGLDFGPKEILVNLIREHYPVEQWADAIDSSGNPTKEMVTRPGADGKPIPVTNPEAERQRDELIEKLDKELNIPANPLDILIENLGGPQQVAELTGRKERFNPITRKFEKRGAGSPDKINLNEMQSFQGGKKRIAILSNAAGTGISLHSDRNAVNQGKRVHITLQAGWSADKAMQMLGRTHRTNQAHPPEYVFITSDLGGEKRFLSTIAKRLSTLGALTKGERSASGGTEAMSKVNFESDQGEAAAHNFYSALLRDVTPPGASLSGMDILAKMNVLKRDPRGGGATVPDKDRRNVTRLLNRLLALEPELQNAVYDFYFDIFEQVVDQAIEEGTLDTGVKEVTGDDIRIKEKRELSVDAETGAATYYYHVEHDERVKRMSGEQMEKLAKKVAEKGRVLRHEKSGKLAFAVEARPITHASGRVEPAFHVYTPARSTAQKMGQDADLRAWRDAGSVEDSMAEWDRQHEAASSHVTHEKHLIGGAVLKWWNAVREASSKLEIYSAQDSSSKERIVGVEVDATQVQSLISKLTGGASTVNARQVYDDVLRNGTRYQLESGTQVVRGRIGRASVVQFIPGSTMIGDLLRDMGVKYERGVMPVHYITDNHEGRMVLDKVMAQFPAVDSPRASLRQAEAGSEEITARYDADRETVMVSPAALDLIRSVFGPGPRPTGLHLEPNQVRRVREHLIKNDHWEVVRAIDDAQMESLSISLVEETGNADSDQATVSHERWHETQRVFGVGVAESHLSNARSLTDTQLGKKAIENLRANGYKLADPGHAAVEIGAHLVGGPLDWAEMGLSREEALELLELYVDLLIADHGDGVLSHLARIAPKLNEGLRNGRKETESGIHRRRTQQIPSIDAGEAQGREAEVRSSLRRNVQAGAVRKAGPPAKDRLTTSAADVFRPTLSRIAAQGAAGARLAKRIEQSGDAGERSAGQRVALLDDLKIDKLSRDDRFHLTDVLEGRAIPRNQQIKDLAAAVRGLQSGIAAEAMAAGVLAKQNMTVKPGDPRPVTLTKQQNLDLDMGKDVHATVWRPFRQRKNYFPHVIRSMGELQANSQLRRDVIENLVRIKVARDTKKATEFLNDYIAFLDKGGRVQSMIDYLIRSGQARDDAQAFHMLNRFREQAIQRQGSLEHSREINLPFWDPDPARVLPHALASQSMRIKQIEGLGQHNQFVKRAIKDIHDAGGDVKTVTKAVDLILKHVNDGDTQAERVSRLLRTWQGFKLGLAAIPNATQAPLNTLLAADLRAVVAGFQGVFTAKGRRFGLESGATLESVLNESRSHAGGDDSRFGYYLSQYLKAVGFAKTEQFNRIFAANAGANYGKRLIEAAGKGDKHAARRLEALGVDAKGAISRGRLTADEVLNASKKFSDITQFRSRPQDLPMFAGHPIGKVFFQFKNYIYGQSRLLHREFVQELRAKNYGRAVRSVLLLSTVFPLTGAAIEVIRNLATGRDDDDEGLRAYFDGMAQVGALAVFGDLVQAVRYRRVLGWAVGPSLSEVSDAIEVVGNAPFAKDTEKAMGNLLKWGWRKIPLLGQLTYHRLPWILEKTGIQEKKPAKMRPLRELMRAS